MNHRCAPGRIPGRRATGFLTALAGVCLAATAGPGLPVSAAWAAGVGPVAVAGQLEVEPPGPDSGGDFLPRRLGTVSEPHTFRYQNTGLVPVTISEVTLDEPGRFSRVERAPESTKDAFSVMTDCPGAVLLPQATCDVSVTFRPLRPGASAARIGLHHDGNAGTFEPELIGYGTLGLYQAGAFGEVLPYNGATPYGDLSHVALESPILGIATTPSGEGYWLMEAAGTMHPFGDAPDLGSPDLSDADYATSVAATPTGNGYWLATQTGGVYAVGDAVFFGSVNAPLADDVTIADMAATPTGRGYWLLDSAGGVYAFGDAGDFGSAASLPPRFPLTGIAPTATGQGYWLVDALGGVFAYGDAAPYSTDSTYSAQSVESALEDAVISARPAPYGQGFAYTRLRGAVAARGLDFSVDGSTYPYGYRGLQDGSIAVDIAFNVPPLQPSAQAGTVVAQGQPGLRAPRKVCSDVPHPARQFFGPGMPHECAVTPLPPSSPAPPADPPTPPGEPAIFPVAPRPL